MLHWRGGGNREVSPAERRVPRAFVGEAERRKSSAVRMPLDLADTFVARTWACVSFMKQCVQF